MKTLASLKAQGSKERAKENSAEAHLAGLRQTLATQATQAESSETPAPVVDVTLWRDGFTVGPDGRLRSYTAGGDFLRCLRAGKVPPELAREFGARLDVRLRSRREEAYEPPPQRPFHGAAHRLGTPITLPPSLPRREPEPEQHRLLLRLPDGERLVTPVSPEQSLAEIREELRLSHPHLRPFSFRLAGRPKQSVDECRSLHSLRLLNSTILIHADTRTNLSSSPSIPNTPASAKDADDESNADS